MRRLAALLALVLAAAVPGLAPRPAAAEPFTNAFDPLVLELNSRDDALPSTGLTSAQKQEKAALAKCFETLSTPSADVGGDLRMAGKMAKTLGGVYPGDPAIDALVDGVLDDLESLVRDDRDELAVALALLAEGKFKTKAADLLDAADSGLLASAGAGTAAQRTKILRKAEGSIQKGLDAAARGNPGGPPDSSTMTATVKGLAWAANSDFGTALTGLATVADGNDGLRKIIVVGRRILPKTGTPPEKPLPGASTTLQLTLTAISADIGTGSFPIGVVNDYAASATWTEEDENGTLHIALATGGNITLNAATVSLGSVSLSGNFSLTLRDGETGATFTATSGAFDATGLPRVSP